MDSFFRVDPDSNLTLSTLDLPLRGILNRRGLATGYPEIVWCCQNSTTYITINTKAQVATDLSFNATEILQFAIKDVEDIIIQTGNAMVGGQWGLSLNKKNSISVDDSGDRDSEVTARHLTWPVLRNGLKALNDFVQSRNLTHSVRGLVFGIHSAFIGQVGEASIS